MKNCKVGKTNGFNMLGATRLHFTLWRACHGMRHGVIQRYEIHFKRVTRNIHLLLNGSCRPFVASLWYLQSFFLDQLGSHN